MTELPSPKSSVEGDVTTYDYECPLGADLNPVSYTHLDVYKRQLPLPVLWQRV